MKRLILSVLMLLAATLIFSQASENLEDDVSTQEIVKQEDGSLAVG
ncbi:hypothetical protein [Hanstruepera marina]|nr:hypothetical protein [Hanstruepera marina]